jgi:hypothetical protein
MPSQNLGDLQVINIYIYVFFRSAQHGAQLVHSTLCCITSALRHLNMLLLINGTSWFIDWDQPEVISTHRIYFIRTVDAVAVMLRGVCSQAKFVKVCEPVISTRLSEQFGDRPIYSRIEKGKVSNLIRRNRAKSGISQQLSSILSISHDRNRRYSTIKVVYKYMNACADSEIA